MTFRPSPELALTMACCRWPRSAERDAAVREAAAAVTDWNLFERLVARHRVIPLARDGLACAGVEVPRKTQDKLASAAERCAVTALQMARESVRLQRALDAAGLPSLIIKGTAVGVRAYGDPCLKQSSDIDLLTSPEAASEARALLETLGYELHDPPSLTEAQFARFTRYAIEAVLYHRENGLTVELHWRLDRNRQLLSGTTVAGPSQTVSVAGADLRTFADEDLFAYLCTHGTKHGWARLKWLADLNALVSTCDDATIERLYEAAVHAGAGRAPGASLLLCRRLFARPLPLALASRLERDRHIGFLESAALHYIGKPIAATDPWAPFPLRLYFSLLFVAPGFGYASEQLRNTWNHPFELARFGRAAHLWRFPLWLGRRAKGLSARLGAYMRAGD